MALHPNSSQSLLICDLSISTTCVATSSTLYPPFASETQLSSWKNNWRPSVTCVKMFWAPQPGGNGPEDKAYNSRCILSVWSCRQSEK
ncbi:hypothetical protein BDZ94DRAFT_1266249 [Collybia nuda]|uniref:Uncharacterized protein n=1 Tax=Collybia nuda TaxID=64659 RepID=A0A9P5Y0X6_9AGAR|nr:hypothetical protein BDZ94DRAFT_1266249 [Collybia nuda]